MSGRGSNNGSSSSSPNRSHHHHHHHHRRFPSVTVPPTNNSSTSSPPEVLRHHQQQQRQQQQQHHGAPTPRPGARPPSSYVPPLLLTVRFPTGIDDILLDIPHPNQTTVVALKHLIRSRLQQPDSQKRLRFIHSGKILPDNAVLGSVIKPLPPPPRDDRSVADPKGKGKAVEGAAHQHAQRVYLICSIDVQLTDAELAEEKRRAEEPPPTPQATPAPTGSPFYPPGSGQSPGMDTGGADNGGGVFGAGAGGMATNPLLEQRGPRGFDRLLSAGMSTAEVNQLRLSFRSMHEARNTADTMPSPDTLRDMEDAWLDNNNDAGMNTANSTDLTEGGAAVAGGGEEFGLPGVLDLLFKGMFIGFVWPLGAIAWLVRGDEEKIPKRMRMFVYFGFVLSLLVGTIRVIG